ncbi:uncharacterized protein LOC119275714 [Triticum dicoccoides]|nr:uncharacterized protein LOC119275714 [Triticum dicoccoides]XP_044348372.1 uncharacterized protein LOC123069551 [Triticum aestivum]CDM82418.1 unnamed protein product [Triticum aestivum]CDM82488.1 unnamed protein product [Triticum aestivum]
MQGHAHGESGLATAPSSPARYLCSGRDGECDEDGGGIHYFFSAPASPVHYILRSPPASSASVHYAPSADGDFCTAPGDFEFAARHRGIDGAGGTTTMSSAEELFLSGRIRVGCLSPIRQETDCREQQGEDGGGVDGRSPRPRRTRSVSPPRSPRLAKTAEPADSLASASSSSSSSSSAKTMRRRISLRDLLGRTCSDPSMRPPAPITTAAERSGSWLPSIWPTRAKKALPCSAPQPARRSVSSVRAAAPGGAGRDEGPRRRTTSLPYRQGLVLGCLGLGARSYGLAKSMHPLSTR